MATEFISNSWLMPENSNKDKLANYSLDFDAASSNYINLYNGTVANLPTEFSIGASDSYSFSFWIKSNVTTSSNFFYTQRGSAPYLRFYTNYISGDDSYRVYFIVRDDSYVEITENSDSTNLVNRNAWNHIVGIIDRSASKLYVYVNGTVTGTGTSLGSLGAISQQTDVAIGGDPYPSGSIRYEFDGEISSASIFDYALTSSQVTQLYGTGSAIGNPMAITNGRKPVAYYPLGNAGFNGEFLVPNGAEQDYVFDFDGSNTKINYTQINFSTASTLSAWAKRNTAANMFLFGNTNSGGYGCYFVGTSGVYVQGSGGYFAFTNAAVTTAMARTDFVNWVFIKDSSTNLLSVYVDGVLAQTTTSAAGMDSLTSIGGSGLPTGNQFIWDGLISNVSIFNTLLSATGTESVESLYNYGTPPNIASWSNLQAWWKLDASATFDGSNFSIPDASGNSNTGTSSGMTAASLTQSDLIINQSYDPFSLNFDGIDGHIDLTEVDLGINSTLSFWLRANTSGWSLSDIIFGSGGASSYLLYIQNTTMYVKIGSITKTFTHSMVVDNWYHMTIVRTGDSAEVFQNGVSVGTQTGYGTGTNTLFDSIGARASGVLPFDGQISNISAYNSSLTSAQVTTLYNSGKPFDLNTFAVTPTNWWRLGSVNSSFDGTNWNVLDEISTSGNNGTSENMTQADLVDGVGATGSGTSSGMGSGENRKGTAPYSESNAVSYNLSVTAKSTSVPT